MKNPLISIIVPIFNVQSYLRECLDSILQQGYKNLDIILVDDGSSDESLEIAKEYLAKDERFFLIQKPNGGLSSARNMGLEFIKNTTLRENITLYCGEGGGSYELPLSYSPTHSFHTQAAKLELEQILKHFKLAGKNHIITDLSNNLPFITQKMPQNQFIHFLDSDDYFLPDCLQRCVDLLNKYPQSEIIDHQFEQFFQHQNKFAPSWLSFKEGWAQPVDFFNNYTQPYFTWVWRGMFEASLLNRYHLRFQYQMDYEDCDFGSILFTLSQGIAHEDFTGVIYRVREDSLSNFNLQTPFPKILPAHLQSLRNEFEKYYDLKKYFGANCYLKITSILTHLTHEPQITSAQKQILIGFAAEFFARALGELLSLKKDPLHLFEKARNLLPRFSKSQKKSIKERYQKILKREYRKKSLLDYLKALIFLYCPKILPPPPRIQILRRLMG